jgi:hypothetical protein
MELEVLLLKHGEDLEQARKMQNHDRVILDYELLPGKMIRFYIKKVISGKYTNKDIGLLFFIKRIDYPYKKEFKWVTVHWINSDNPYKSVSMSIGDAIIWNSVYCELKHQQ